MFVAGASIAVATGFGCYFSYRYLKTAARKKPISVNYHFTRKCNYECGFCFHTAKTSYILPIDGAKRGIKLLVEAGMRKINFAGGELFLYPAFLGELVRYCKHDLHLESVSIVTNGSLVKEKWLETYVQHLDIMAVSCDSFDETTNKLIGRGKGSHLQTFVTLSRLCRKYDVKFKVNTVVCRYNLEEDMNEGIEEVAPFRWKCFQVLVVPGENDSSATLRNARRFIISDDEYEAFCDRHRRQASLVPESNAVMKSSYVRVPLLSRHGGLTGSPQADPSSSPLQLILDEYMRFLNKGVKGPTQSILDVGVPAAMDDVYWDDESFARRGGEYDWQKEGANKETKNTGLDFSRVPAHRSSAGGGGKCSLLFGALGGRMREGLRGGYYSGSWWRESGDSCDGGCWAFFAVIGRV